MAFESKSRNEDSSTSQVEEEEEEADDENEVEDGGGGNREDEDEIEDERIIHEGRTAPPSSVVVGEERRSESEEVEVTQAEEQTQKKTVIATLDAKEVYILMSKEYRISRNRRAEWFFSNVNSCLSFPPDEEEVVGSRSSQSGGATGAHTKDNIGNGSSDFEVVSIIPLNPPQHWSFDNRQAYRYRVIPKTVVTYLSRRYRIVFCLDISPSVASVDVQAGGVVFDNIFSALQSSLHGLLQPFEVPGSRRMFRPEIFITVIAHTPFFTPVTDQVLLQGEILDAESCSQIVKLIFDRLHHIENRLARIVGSTVPSDNNIDSFGYSYNDSDSMDGDNVQDGPANNTSSQFASENVFSALSMNPDFGLLDLLRQALIALSLMPENSSAGLVIFTDGVISVPDGRYLDIILSQLRYNTVSCSFIQMSSPFHPHLCHGVIPYADLMKFIASATFGAFLSEAPDVVRNNPGSTAMNVYHMAFLAWSFQKTLETDWTKPGPPANVKPGEWSVRNKCFFSVRDMPIVKKQQYENILHVDHMKVMSCRLREGFTIKEVITSPETGLSEVTLILPWKFLIHLEYKILIDPADFDDGIGDMGGSEPGYPPRVRCVVSLEGPYDFLHDVTCLAKKPFSSLYRQLMVNRFWATRKNLSESDRLLVHLNSFSSNPAYYNIPDSLKNGVPLFYWGPTTANATPHLHTNEMQFPQFTHFWKPVCLLDTTVWQKWMHTHRIGVVLEHDYPLPKNIHLPNSTGRFNVIQCRQAVMALNTLLKNMSSFVLLENQCYVHLMFREEEKVPHSFCLIRVTSKPPHVVLRLAFLVGTPGHLRHRTVATFREKIATLTFPQRVKDPPKWRVITNPPAMSKAATVASPLVNKTSWSEMPCCVLVHKPVEKILIRYEKSPEDFRKRLLSQDALMTSFTEGKSSLPKQSTFGFRPTYQAPWGNTSIQMLPEVFNTIARYLHHKRWIWWFPGGELPPLNFKWASEILATVTKIRLQEGFRFAYSSAGITNMVLELPMKNDDTSRRSTATPLMLQFVIFPPTSTLTSDLEEFDSFEVHDSLYIVTECWVEPQCGKVSRGETQSVTPNFLNLNYSALPKQMFETDYKCISLVGTFEYLVRICSNTDVPFLISVNQSTSEKVCVDSESIEVIPFQFDLKQILMRSGQVEMLFSSFFQDLSLTFPNEWNASVCSFFERANNVLYQQWCVNVASFQNKEVQLTKEQHQVATNALLQRKGIEKEPAPEDVLRKRGGGGGGGASRRSQQNKDVQWRCFVRSSSSTHVLVTLIPATLKDMKLLLTQLESMEAIHKTKCSRYVDFLDFESAEFSSSQSGGGASSQNASCAVECPNQLGVCSSANAASGSSPPIDANHLLSCRTCQNSRKRVRAFSGGECAPASKKYLTDEKPPVVAPVLHPDEQSTPTSGASLHHHHSIDDRQRGDEDNGGFAAHAVRSQTFSEGTVSGKLAQFMRAKRTLSDQSGSEQQDENVCSDPQRCSQLNDYLNRTGGGASSGTGGGSGTTGLDDNLRYVPCRTPIIGSVALCAFTYSCSLMSLTDHVIFRKLSRDGITKDFRISRSSPCAGSEGYDDDFRRRSQADDDDDEDDEDEDAISRSLFPNGRTISQESFSESSLQRLELAEHEQLLREHCLQLKKAHLQAYISSAYRSLLSGYPINQNDISVVVDKCTLTRVLFPLDNFLQFVCRHEKDLSEMMQAEENKEKEELEGGGDKVVSSPQTSSQCSTLEPVHNFIQKRFRRLLSRNFSAASDNGHVLFYKVAISNALSDMSGMVKCSSDLEDNMDSYSIVADSLCSADDCTAMPPPSSSVLIVSDNETTEKSPIPRPSTVTTVTNLESTTGGMMNDEQCSISGFTVSSAAPFCSPLFSYVTCRVRVEEEPVPEEDGRCCDPVGGSDDTVIPLVDIPTCYHELSSKYLRIRRNAECDDSDDVDAESDNGRDGSHSSPKAKVHLFMELTFLTAPTPASNESSQDKPEDSPTNDVFEEKVKPHKKNSNASPLHLADFKRKLPFRQARAIENIVSEIEWLMEDEITSFRASEPQINEAILEEVANHVEKSKGKLGCFSQTIPLTFVEHSDEQGFLSFLERFNDLSVDEYSFQREGMWWYLLTSERAPHTDKDVVEDAADNALEKIGMILPPFWIILKGSSTQLELYHHCRHDENDVATLTFSRSLRVQITELISNLIRTINQDLLLQQLHDTRMCSPLLEVDDRDPQNFDLVSEEGVIPPPNANQSFLDLQNIFGSESDISSTMNPTLNFVQGMFSCEVVWGTTFILHSRLRSGGGKTAFARGIQTLRSTLIAFEVANRKNMFVYRDATGNVFYMRFYRAVDVLESPSKELSSIALASGLQGSEQLSDFPDSDLTSVASDEAFSIPLPRLRRKHNDSESEKTSRDDAFDGILCLRVHGIVPAGEEIKDKLVQSLRNKLDDAVLDILSVTLKRNPHCKLTPEDVHFLQEPRSKPDSVFKFALSNFVSRHLPAFAYYLHQNLLQFLTMPKYTSTKSKYHFQDYARLEESISGGGAGGEQSSVYLYNQSPGGGGTGNRGIAIVSMALTDRIGNLIKNPEWRQPDIDSECDLAMFGGMIETREVVAQGSGEVLVGGGAEVIIEFGMWMQGRINVELLKSHVDLALKHAGWDLIMEYKVLTAPLSSNGSQEEEVFTNLDEDSSGSGTLESNNGSGAPGQVPQEKVVGANAVGVMEKRRRSSHLNPGTSRGAPSTGGPEEEDDEPRTRSMSFTGLRKPATTEGNNEQPRDRAPSPVTLISGRGGSEGSRPRILVSRPQHQMSLTKLETGDVGNLHANYVDLLDNWVENGIKLGAPSLRRIEIPFNCRYPVRCIVLELEKILSTVAADNTSRQFWKTGGATCELEYVSSGGGGVGGGTSTGGRRDSGDDAFVEFHTMKRHEKELLSLENTEEAEYPLKILNLFRRNDCFHPDTKEGDVCLFLARNLAHWKSCLNCEADFALHTSQDFKNLYTYPPLLNDSVDMDGSRGSIEKLPRGNFSKEFVLWSGKRDQGRRNSLILIPRQRLLRAKVTGTEVKFVVYNWSKDCCERLQEKVTQLSDWVQARASLLSSLLAQKAGIFYCQPILPDNFASSLSKNPFIMGDVELKDLILNTPPGKQSGFDRRSTIGSRKMLMTSANSAKATQWADFYRNIPLCNLLGMPDTVGENLVDSHGRQLLHILNVQEKEPENTFFQYWLTLGPSASNVITTQVLESFKQAARTIHFCLTPVMFSPSWRAAVAQTRDSGAVGGIIRRNRGSSRRSTYQGTMPPRVNLPTGLSSVGIVQSRVRHGSEASQASSLSLRNRSRSYHSGMVNLFLPELSEKESADGGPGILSPSQQQQQALLMKVKSDEPWHGLVCRLFIQEYMQYLQTLGFVPVHCKGAAGSAGGGGPPGGGSPANNGGSGGPTAKMSPLLHRAGPGGGGGGVPGGPPLIKRKVGGGEGGVPQNLASVGASKGHRENVSSAARGGNAGSPAVKGISSGNGTSPNIGLGATGDGIEEGDDERMCHFLQRCLPGGIMVVEVGLVPPFFYCKLHALEAKRIFPKGPKNKHVFAQNAVQFVDECEKMKILTHLHSFMYDFHMRVMFLYISGRQLLFKSGYHITSFLDDFITYYPKCPNFSRNAVHIGEVVLEDVTTPSQVLFSYILGHDKYYRMKVIQMTALGNGNSTNSLFSSLAASGSGGAPPFIPSTGLSSETGNEYVLVHNMSRKVSYRDREDETQSDEFDLTLVIAHDYPTASRDFVPDYQGLRVKYYIVLTSRRELYPKGDNEPNSGKLCQVNTPEPLCTRHLQCQLIGSASGANASSKLHPPPVQSTFNHSQQQYAYTSQNLVEEVSSQSGHKSKGKAVPDLIREEKVRYMGFFSSHEQLMQKIIDEQRDTMEQFIRTLVTKAAVDCKRDLLWGRLLTGRPADQSKVANSKLSAKTRVRETREDILSREILGPLFFWDFEELLELVHVVPLKQVDPRLEDLLKQPINFYQSLIKVLMASGHNNANSPYNYREFVSSDHLIHQLAIFTPDSHKSIVLVEMNMDKVRCDIFLVFKDGNKGKGSTAGELQGIPEAEMGDPVFSLVEKVVNACCYTTWATLI